MRLPCFWMAASNVCDLKHCQHNKRQKGKAQTVVHQFLFPFWWKRAHCLHSSHKGDEEEEVVDVATYRRLKTTQDQFCESLLWAVWTESHFPVD